MNCRHTSRFPITGTSRKINENARPSGVGENSGKTKVHIISSGSNDNGALPLFRQSFCVHAHRLSFCRPGSLPYYHPLSLRSPGGAGFLNLPLKTNFTKKFRSPLENGESSGYCKGIGHEPPDSQAAVVPSNGTLPIFSCKRFILACGAVFGQARLVTRGSTPQAFFVALNRQQKRNTKMFANHKEAKA